MSFCVKMAQTNYFTHKGRHELLEAAHKGVSSLRRRQRSPTAAPSLSMCVRWWRRWSIKQCRKPTSLPLKCDPRRCLADRFAKGWRRLKMAHTLSSVRQWQIFSAGHNFRARTRLQTKISHEKARFCLCGNTHFLRYSAMLKCLTIKEFSLPSPVT
jgi:hypothetical protein